MSFGGTLGSILVTGLAMGAVYALIGITYNLMFTASRVMSFTAGQLGMLGGVFGSLFALRLGNQTGATRNGDRPLLTGDPLAKLQALAAAREPRYRQAHLTIDASLAPKGVAASVLEALRNLDAVEERV